MKPTLPFCFLLIHHLSPEIWLEGHPCITYAQIFSDYALDTKGTTVNVVQLTNG